MYENKTIYTVVPCYNEEAQIGRVIETMPAFVDRIVVVDDVSHDRTCEVVQKLAAADPRVVLIRHETNRGVGAAIATGYILARDEKADVTVVMAGDAQMDPADYPDVILPVVRDIADYCKGNRFKYFNGLKKIPPIRKAGNFMLSFLTKIASGYWHISDSQTGYTAINLRALRAIDLREIYPRYGCPNDILVKLNIAEMRVIEVPVNPLYSVGERSKMKIPRVVPNISLLLLNLFARRIFLRYVVDSGHPIFLYYICATLAFLGSATTFIYSLIKFGVSDWVRIPLTALMVSGFLFIVALQLTLAAFTLDFETNRHLIIYSPPRLDPPAR